MDKTKRMMNRTEIPAAVLLLLLAATACGEHEAERRDGGVPVSVSAGMGNGDGHVIPVGGTTRAATDIYERTFEEGDQFYAVLTGCTVDNTTYTLLAPAGSGSAARNAATPTVQPFVRSGQPATITGYFPFRAGSAAMHATDRLSAWTVRADQSAAGYQQSDLMYAATTTVADDGTATLEFRHRMAKLTVMATAGQGITAVTAIRLVQGCRTIAVSSPATLTLGTALSDPVSPAAPLIVAAASATGACLLPPQVLKGGVSLVQVVTTEGSAYYALDADKTLTSGNSYSLSITVKLTDIGLTTTVADWQAGATPPTPALTQAQTYEVGGVKFSMVHVTGGEYNVLRGTTVKGQLSNFYIASTEVTNALWQAVMGWKPTVSADRTKGQPSDADTHPVGFTTREQILQADGFIDRLNALTASQRPEGWLFTLPTEAQWEYAARGGIYKTGNHDYAGGYAGAEAGWFAGETGSARTFPVATKKPNELGLYDMSGNVWELCLNNYGGDVAANADLGLDSYCYTGTDTRRAYRGGSYDNAVGENARLSRCWNPPVTGENSMMGTYGLRVALVYSCDYGYTGAVQTWTAPADGWYRIECWGASGGDNTGRGGRGGYSTGYVYKKQGDVLYVYVGDTGSGKAKTATTWNGGGNGTVSAGGMPGGGASDVRTVQCSTATTAWKDNANGSEATDASLLSRIIVAGGGGGGMSYGSNSNAAYIHRDGGYGGGTTGADGQKSADTSAETPTRYTYLDIATGGTQTAGGKGGVHTSASANGGADGEDGAFGRGGNAGQACWGNGGTAKWGSGGGGGWYGGGAGGWIHNIVGTGGGGSSYTGGVVDGSMIAGNQPVPPVTKAAIAAGTWPTGHTGAGHVRITPGGQRH